MQKWPAIGGRRSEVGGRRLGSSTLNTQRSALKPRSGFTLLEVLVALGLSVILLAAVYGAIHLSYRLTTTGRVQMEEAQLVRALFQQIDSDIRSVVFALQEPVAAESDGEAADEGTDTEVEPESLTTDEALVSTSSGLYGDRENLVLHVSRPSRIMSQRAFAGSGQIGDRSDLAAVSYFLAIQGASGLPGSVARMASQSSLLNAPRSGTVTGLTRLEGDRLSITFAEETGDTESLAEAAQILAPEVVSLSFAFWDGAEWTDSWDTVTEKRLPNAIEITLGIDTDLREQSGLARRSQNDLSGIASTANEAEPAYYRHVVALPLAEPYVGEASQ